MVTVSQIGACILRTQSTNIYVVKKRQIWVLLLALSNVIQAPKLRCQSYSTANNVYCEVNCIGQVGSLYENLKKKEASELCRPIQSLQLVNANNVETKIYLLDDGQQQLTCEPSANLRYQSLIFWTTKYVNTTQKSDDTYRTNSTFAIMSAPKITMLRIDNASQKITISYSREINECNTPPTTKSLQQSLLSLIVRSFLSVLSRPNVVVIHRLNRGSKSTSLPSPSALT